MGLWLVVEDEDDIRNIVKVMFKVWGYDPLEFRNGHEAWRWLDAIESGTYSGDLPELALLDIRMPGHKGNEIAKRMRSLDALKSMPIVLMTAFSLSDGEYQEMLRECGVDKIIHKPLPDLFELKTTLDTVRDKKRTQAARASQPPTPGGDQPASDSGEGA
ncbi:response regulator [Aggregatilinea lenta]|uniref:response regulator n=1 Tax=Aggregatilinea lenta TaxID=913108 RepID=UPI000E5B8972|nr:response regulator [Aggregatilinea lenta]